jgi:hypothetical protein
MLNTKQNHAVTQFTENFRNWKKDTKPYFVELTGGAGTGKTFVIEHILKDCLNVARANVLVLAPTNSAKKQIQRSMQNISSDMANKGLSLRFQTVASFLGKLPELDSKGNIDFVEGKALSRKNPLTGISILIIEESSMVGKKDAKKILEEVGGKKIFVIFLGDKYQLFPVFEDTCELLNIVEPKDRVELTVSQRQKEGSCFNKITNLCREAVINKVSGFDLRNTFPDDIIEDGAQYRNYWDSDDAFKQIIRGIKAVYANNDPMTFRALCFRNKTVQTINTKIRHLYFGSHASEDYIIGEYLLCNKPVTEKVQVEDDIFTMTLIDNGSIVEVLEKKAEVFNFEFQFGGAKKTVSFNGYTIKAKELDLGTIQNIRLVSSLEKNKYNELCEKIKTACKKYAKENRNFWYHYKEIIELFHDFDYAYTSNAYKVQGLSLKSVAVNLDDIVTIPNVESSNRAQYVCVTRMTNNLLVF